MVSCRMHGIQMKQENLIYGVRLGVLLLLTVVFNPLGPMDSLSLYAQKPSAPPLKKSLSKNYEGKLLQTIIIKGNVAINEKKIKAQLNFLKEGNPLYKDFIRKDFKTLYQSGLFQGISFELDETPNQTLILTIHVDELPKISAVTFYGNRKLNDDDLYKDLPIQKGDYYSKNQINHATLHIKNLYREEGYLIAKVVASEKTNQAKQTIELIFDIIEGSEVLTGDITFLGNKNIKTSTLTKAMKTKKDQWYRKGKFDEYVLEEDQNQIIHLYKKKGYINAQILEVKLNHRWKNPATKKVKLIHIMLTLSEGEQYFFGDVTIRGNRLFTTKELMKAFKRKKGKVFNEEIHQLDVRNIGTRYHQRGYIYARITPIEQIDNTDKKVHYTIDIYEGDIAHIENIFITGNDKTKTHVIQRELLIREGELFNITRLQLSRERVMNLQFFSNVVPEYRAGSVEGLMNVNFRVEERSTASILGGLGFGSVSGFTLNAEIRENNFLGNGQTIGAKVEFGQRRKILSLNYTEPWFLGYPISLGTSVDVSRETLYYQADRPLSHPENETNETSTILLPNGETNVGQEIDYTRDSYGFAVHSTQRFYLWYRNVSRVRIDFERNFLMDTPDWFTLNRFSQKEIYQLNQGRFSEPPPDQSDFNFVYTLSDSISRDTRDNWLNTTRGSQVSLGFDYILGDYSLTKWNFTYSKYYELFKYLVGAYSFQLSTLANAFNNQFIYSRRLYYRFYREEIRGWESHFIADFRNALFNNQHITSPNIAGKAKVRHSLELRFPIVRLLLWGLIYLDAGNLSSDFLGVQKEQYDFLISPEQHMYDAGFGFRIQVPQLPLRLYWSWRFIYDPEDNRFELFQHNADLFSTGIIAPTFVLTIAGFF